MIFLNSKNGFHFEYLTNQKPCQAVLYVENLINQIFSWLKIIAYAWIPFVEILPSTSVHWK